jgi:PAS domain S-box-containing protein
MPLKGKVLANPVEILLVDDRADNLLTLEVALSSPQYKLIKANSGEEALRYLLDHKPALILLDVQMPKMDGFACANIIKNSERTRDIPIIFLTALPRDERFVHRGYQTGAVDYLSKPFDVEILRSKVKVFAELHRKNEQLLTFERDLRVKENEERERKLAALELNSLRREQIQQRRYQELVDGIHHGIVWSANPESLVFSYVGPTAEKLLGYSKQQWFGEADFWMNHIHTEDAATFLSVCQKVVKEHSSADIEHRFITSDGRTVWLQTGVRYGSGGSGDVRRELHGLSVDITRLKTTEALLQKSKKRSDLLAQISFVLSNSLQAESVLKEICRLAVPQYADWFSIDLLDETGLKACCVSGLSIVDNDGVVKEFNSEMPDLHADNDFAYMFESGRYVSYRQVTEKNLQRLAGTPRRAKSMASLKSAIMAPILIRQKPFGAITIGSHIEERFDSDDVFFLMSMAQRVGVALENSRLYQEAQAAIKIRDEFLSIASHELKTPLTPLKLQIQQLLRMLSQSNTWDRDRMERLLSTSNRQISRLAKLIEELLDISRLSRGQLQLEIDEFSLPELIEDVTQRFGRQLEEAGCELVLDLETDLRVHWDAFRIEQVIVNLLANAIKYAAGKPVHIEARRKDDLVSFVVRDHGIGIAAEDQGRIFKRFERAVSKDHFGGMGLGLYIVSQILQLHGGSIRVESNIGEGSAFVVEIPAMSQPEAPVAPKSAVYASPPH